MKLNESRLCEGVQEKLACALPLEALEDAHWAGCMDCQRFATACTGLDEGVRREWDTPIPTRFAERVVAEAGLRLKLADAAESTTGNGLFSRLRLAWGVLLLIGVLFPYAAG